MKRRLALLLALSLSFASFPVAGVGAAEADTPAAATQTVEQAEETQPEETEEATENEDAGTDKSGEAAVEAASTETAAEVTESAEEEKNAEVTEEAAAAETTETEAAPEEEASAAATTSEEAAVVEEPAAVEESAVQKCGSEQRPAAAPVPAKVDPKTVKKQTETKKVADGWYSNNTVYYKNGKKVTGLQYLVFNGVTRTFFFNSSGVKQTGWKTIDNKGTVCYFADSRWPALPAGAMLTGLRKLGNYWFYMADSSFAK